MRVTKARKKERAARRARRFEGKPQPRKLTPAEELRLDVYLTFIFVLQEVTMRYVTMTMDHPALYFKLKEKMNKFIRAGDELNEIFRQYIKGDPYHEDPEESMDVEADRLFELVNATAPMSTDEQWIKAISSIKAIAGLSHTKN